MQFGTPQIIDSTPVEIIKKEYTIEYIFQTNSGCRVAVRTAFGRDEVHNYFDKLNKEYDLRNVDFECRYTPSWAGRRHRNVKGYIK